jgi:hypothetical protein
VSGVPGRSLRCTRKRSPRAWSSFLSASSGRVSRPRTRPISADLSVGVKESAIACPASRAQQLSASRVRSGHKEAVHAAVGGSSVVSSMYARADAPVAAVPNEVMPNDSDGYTRNASLKRSGMHEQLVHIRGLRSRVGVARRPSKEGAGKPGSEGIVRAPGILIRTARGTAKRDC